MSTKRSVEISHLAELEDKIYPESATRYALAFLGGAALTVLYKPGSTDGQTPHEKDEVYVIARGTATLEALGNSIPLETGDAAFVAARCEHRFVDISADFLCWAIFLN